LEEALNNALFRLVSDCAEEQKCKAYVIGGWVRDLFLGRPSKDIDIVVLGSGIDLASEVARKAGIRKVNYFRNFGTANFLFNDIEVEFVGARKESYRQSSRKPVVEDGTLEEDQNRRDFTINAMAICLNKDDWQTLLDPFNGIQDLHNRIIRTPRNPEVTFSDDPLRMMRAIRFATQLNFTINDITLEAITKQASRISIVSKEKINDELTKIILSEKPSVGFLLLFKTGLLQYILPELIDLKGTEYIEGKGHKDNFYHTLEVLDNVALNTGDLWIRWAAILHDIAKPATKKYEPGIGWTFHAHDFLGAKMVPRIFKRMKMPLNEKMKLVQKLVSLHLRPIALTEEEVTDSAVRRLLFEAGADIDALMVLCEADITSKNPAKVKRYLANFKIVREKLKEVELKDKLRNWQPPITGEIIMKAFDIPAGRIIGEIKTTVREAILDGVIDNNFNEAFGLMEDAGRKLGLRVNCSRENVANEKEEWEKRRDAALPPEDTETRLD